MAPLVEPFFDTNTGTFSYVVYSQTGKSCAVVDPLRDYEGSSARTGQVMADQILEFITRKGLQLEWLLETHIHADHLSASGYLKERLGGKIATSAAVKHVAEHFSRIFNGAASTFDPQLHFDHLFEPEEEFYIGDMHATAMHVPGHTQADTAFYVDNSIIFVGDTLFALTWALLVVIFPVATPACYGDRFREFFVCRFQRGCVPLPRLSARKQRAALRIQRCSAEGL